ncbi:MAG: DciA family protein [Actinomycetota bacterium]|nr:DciA family protein [Actinomycetota bacterium]
MENVVPPEEPSAPPEHDPTGLDLARTVAAQLRGMVGRKPVRSTGRKRRLGSPAEFSGAHPDDRDPAPLGAAVERLVSDSGWSTDVSVHTVLGRWAQIVGSEVALHCTPVSYAEGVVGVTADSTAWATQLTLLAATVVARLNAELGDGTVVRIQVSGPGGPTWRRGRRSVRDGRGPRDTYG